MKELRAQKLTQAAFAQFGRVVEVADAEIAQGRSINQGLTTRFSNLCALDTPGVPCVSVFRTNPLPLPHRVQSLERHPRNSQTFIPTDAIPFLVLVARAATAEHIAAADLQLFRTNGQQGVHLYRDTWHHFQIGIQRQRDFIVLDAGENSATIEAEVREEIWIPAAAAADAVVGASA